jgi:murein DD-endopeptidase MepM/ murein hydrolase activator NlpD
MPAPSNPLPLRLVPTSDPSSFLSMAPGTTGLPLLPHPGAFGFARPKYVHTGVDLYCPPGTPVGAIEAGRVVAVLPFTGAHAQMPWWLNTWIVMVEGASGVFAYGDLKPGVQVGEDLKAGSFIGQVVQVLRDGKGRPSSMLHLELHYQGSTRCPHWREVHFRPPTLLDPTPILLLIAGHPAGVADASVTS